MIRIVALLLLALTFVAPARADDWEKTADQYSAGMIGASPQYHRGRVAHVAGRPRAWCGWWLAKHFGLNDRRLWRAIAWAHVGSAASGPAPGVIAVWRHHVGVVTGVPGPGRIVLLSGNDGHAVRERERSSRGVVAWRIFNWHLAGGAW